MYDFTTSRERDGPATFLAGFAGYLQADAYSGYDGLYLGPESAIHEVACWAHARRKFYEAQSSWPGYAGLILEAIGRLYDVEDRARELSAEARQALRARESMPILERLRGELDRLAEEVLPRSSLGKALTYARNQWAALCRYTEDGRLTIDNNVAERRLRDQAIGRNYAQPPIMRSPFASILRCGFLQADCRKPGDRIGPHNPERPWSVRVVRPAA